MIVHPGQYMVWSAPIVLFCASDCHQLKNLKTFAVELEGAIITLYRGLVAAPKEGIKVHIYHNVG